MNIQIGIIGGEENNLYENREELKEVARQIGNRVAKNGAILITGGCSGIADYAGRSALEEGGIVIAIAGRERGKSYSPTTAEICTPIDIGDYAFSGILSSDAIIVLPGGKGTIAELVLAFRNKKSLIFIEGYEENLMKLLYPIKKEEDFVYKVKTADEAIELALKLANQNINKTIKDNNPKRQT